jgi:hypothetical protein
VAGVVFVEEEKESIFKVPLGEALRRDLSLDFLKKEIPGGFLDKEIRFRKRKDAVEEDMAGVQQVTCYACRRATPSTVGTCLHCGAPLEAGYRNPEVPPAEAQRNDYISHENAPVKSLIDMEEEIL